MPGETTLGRFLVPGLALIVVLATFARLYNVNWDQTTHLHPDERGLTIVANDTHLPSGPAEYFNTTTSRFNPYNKGTASFVYGTAPLLLTKVTGALLDKNDYDHLVLVGRWWSALFSAATVLLVFLIGRRLFGPVAGLLGAALIAMAPLAIQHAHFFVVDSFLTFFTTAFLYFCLRVQREGRARDFAMAGLMLGLGLACKLTALVVSPVLFAAAVAFAWPSFRAVAASSALGWSHRRLQPLQGPLFGLFVGLLVTFLAFRVAQPYAFETPTFYNPVSWLKVDKKWLDDQKNQSKLLGGEAGFPPTIQWIDRAKYVYPLSEMLHWGMGPAFGLAGWGALLFAAYRLIKRGDSRLLLPVIFVAVYFGFMGRQFTLYMRYFLPLYPVLALLAGYALLELVRAGPVLAKRWRFPELEHAGTAVAGLTMAVALLTALAYLSIYRAPVTRIEASRWLERNLNEGQTLAIEHWDEGMPVLLPDMPNKNLKTVELPLYEVDGPAKTESLLKALDDADYIVISSNRLQNSIPRNVISYPVTQHWYEMLDSGEMGFHKLREFTSYPRLAGIEFPDAHAEESWSSYDHPRVEVYKKVDYSHEAAEALLNRGPAGAPVVPAKASRHGLLLNEKDLATQRENGSWTSVFSDSGLAHSAPTLVWLILLEAAALAITPIVMVVFRRLPDRGYLLAKPLGVLALAYPVWVLASLKLVHFDRTAILATLLLLIVAGYYVSLRQKDELWGFVRAHWRLVLVCEAVFLLAFFFFREIRLMNPDLWHPSRGGEKPMDLAYLTAVARSTTLPPYDPWFAGGYINYYYLGQYLTATLIKATTIPPEVAFNLAVPTFFALTVAGAFSVSYNLAEATRTLLRRSPDRRRLPAWSPYAAAALGAFLVAVAGNLDGMAQMTDRLSEVSTTHVHSSIPVVATAINSLNGLGQVLFHGASLRDFDYWRPSRMLGPTISITEFPYFSFLYADLHAHMMSFAFDILTIATCLALALGRRGERMSWREWTIVAILGWLTGALRVLNSWDYPPFLLLALTAVAISERRLEGGVAATGKRFLLKGLALGALSVALWWPFLSHYQTPVAGLIRSPETTPLRQYVAHFGVLAAPVLGWLAFLLVRALRASPVRTHGRHLLATPQSETWFSGVILIAGGGFLACMALVIFDHAFIAALLPFFIAVVYLWIREARLRRPDSGLRLLLLSMLGLALGLSMGVDIFTLDGDIQRMNTVFKFYIHIWILLALAASFASWWLVFVVWRVAERPVRRTLAIAGSSALAALVLAAAIYPLAATPVRLDDRFVNIPPPQGQLPTGLVTQNAAANKAKTLDGEAFLHYTTYQDPQGPINFEADYQGFEWLRHNVRGTPAIVEGRTPLYRWGGRFSIYTGLPTVLGWDYHQTQQRGQAAVDVRGREVDAFYASPDVASAQRFLRAYDVRYVILGQVERLYYPHAGLQKFANGLNGTLDVAYQNPLLIIYRVLPDTTVTKAAVAQTSANP